MSPKANNVVTDRSRQDTSNNGRQNPSSSSHDAPETFVPDIAGPQRPVSSPTDASTNSNVLESSSQSPSLSPTMTTTVLEPPILESTVLESAAPDSALSDGFPHEAPDKDEAEFYYFGLPSRPPLCA